MALSGFTPKYQKVFDVYRNRIITNDLQPGARIDSINRIIQKHSVSRDTAKRVLRELTSEGLAISIVGKGSFVAPQKDIQPIWGMIIPFISPNLEHLIGLIMQKAKKLNRNFTHLLHYNNAEEEIMLVGNMIRKGYEAIIVVPNYNENLTADFYRTLLPGKTKVMLADNTMAGSYFNYVIQSYDLGIQRAFTHFEKGNKGNILFVKDQLWQGRNLLQELMEQTLFNLIQNSPSMKAFVLPSATSLTKKFLDKNSIGNILTTTDMDAVKILGRLKEWNVKIPDDISIVNYGNTEVTRYFTPSITAIDCDYEQMADKIIELILCDNKKMVMQHVIAPKLIIRNT